MSVDACRKISITFLEEKKCRKTTGILITKVRGNIKRKEKKRRV